MLNGASSEEVRAFAPWKLMVIFLMLLGHHILEQRRPRGLLSDFQNLKEELNSTGRNQDQ
jgi:hypothetical protein